jgi:hypothetical protein
MLRLEDSCLLFTTVPIHRKTAKFAKEQFLLLVALSSLSEAPGTGQARGETEQPRL